MLTKKLRESVQLNLEEQQQTCLKRAFTSLPTAVVVIKKKSNLHMESLDITTTTFKCQTRTQWPRLSGNQDQIKLENHW